MGPGAPLTIPAGIAYLWTMMVPILIRRAAFAAAGAMLAGAALAADPPPPPFRDGEVTRAGEVVANLTHPTDSYKHGVFGKPLEAQGFSIERGGRRFDFKLAEGQVFEDRRVRLMDVDGDALPEAILVKAYADKGAALAIYKIGKTRIEPMGESEPIGQPNRWLNPVGVVEMGQDGRKFIAAVVTPHLTGSLRFYEWRVKALVEVARLDGVTNHINGSRNLDLAVIQDVDADGADDIVLPSFDRKALVMVTLRAGKAQIAARQELKTGRITEIAAQPKKGTFKLLLDSGESIDVTLETNRADLRGASPSQPAEKQPTRP